MLAKIDIIGYIVCNINIVAQFVAFLIISNSKLVSIHIWLKIKSMVWSKVILGLHLLLYTYKRFYFTLQNTFQQILSVVLSKIHNIG
jgi:hypothetical protein